MHPIDALALGMLDEACRAREQSRDAEPRAMPMTMRIWGKIAADTLSGGMAGSC